MLGMKTCRSKIFNSCVQAHDFVKRLQILLPFISLPLNICFLSSSVSKNLKMLVFGFEYFVLIIHTCYAPRFEKLQQIKHILEP